MADDLVIAGRAFKSRLIVGTGKYRGFQEMARAHAASGADMVTVAVRRVNLTDKSKESLLDYIDREKIFILPNTAACYTADEAIRTARLAREVGLSNWVKLEVIGDQQTLFPDRSEEHTSELQSRLHLVCRLLLEKKNSQNPAPPPFCPTVDKRTTDRNRVVGPLCSGLARSYQDTYLQQELPGRLHGSLCVYPMVY